MSTYSRSGTRRAGDDYQDLFAIEMFVEWLEHPSRYEWMKVEAEEGGFLDDVLALRADGTLDARQIKFATDPDAEDDLLNWEYLLAGRVSKPAAGQPRNLPCLLEKWHRSLVAIAVNREVTAGVFTNRRPAPEVAACLGPDSLIDFDRIADAATRERITRTIGSEAAAREFFTRFQFHLDQPELSEKENGLRRRFMALGGTEEGFLSLKDALRSWVGRKNVPGPGGLITLRVIQRSALWRQLQAMAQDLAVPPDYVLPDAVFHEELLATIRSQRQGCHVLAGGPGMGKSTYLSHLFSELERNEIAVVRHHYFLSAQDRTPGRLDPFEIAGSLMSNLQSRYPAAVGELGSRNPDLNDLEKWLSACADHFNAQGKALVVILDGLDHVWREQASVDGLNRLFERLLPVKPGLIVLVGTQPIEEARLPLRLLREAPTQTWRSLPRLDRAAVRRWVEHHQAECALLEDENYRPEIIQHLADAFYGKSDGHPLLLRYALRQLRESGVPVTAENVSRLSGEPHRDVGNYYAELQTRLSANGRMILHLLAACRFPWPESGITDALAPGGRPADMGAIQTGIREVRFLLEETPWGLRAFHGSLLVFISERKEYAGQSERLRRLALEWLRGNAPETLRWGHLWLLESELGNDEPLRTSPSRDWVIEAVAARRSRAQVSEILGKAAWASLEHGDLGRWCELGLLRDYHHFVQQNGSEASETMLPAQIAISTEPTWRADLHAELSSLSDDAVVTVARAAAKDGDIPGVERCFHELYARFSDPRRWQRSQDESLMIAVLEVVAMIPDGSSEKVLEFLAQRDDRTARYGIGIYARSLREQRAAKVLRGLIRGPLPPGYLSRVVREAILLNCEEGVDFSAEFSRLGEVSDPLLAVHVKVRGMDGFQLGSTLRLPLYSVLNIKEYEQYQYGGEISDLFYWGFFGFLANHLWDRAAANADWLRSANGHAWPIRFLERLNAAAAEVAVILANGSPLPFAFLHRCLADTPPPEWMEDRDAYSYGTGAQDALAKIGFDLRLISTAPSGRTIAGGEVRAILASPFCRDVQKWIKTFLRQRHVRLDPAGVDVLLAQQSQVLDRFVGHFPERSRACAVLAELAALHGRDAEAASWLRRGAANALAYGEHKDLLLDAVMDTLQSCHDASVGGERQRGWLVRIAPAISAVREYTDGDETRHVRNEYVALLAKAAPDLLLRYHDWQIQQEKFDAALQAFHAYLKTADLDGDLAQGVAATAADRESLLILAERAGQGDVGAATALGKLAEFLGGLPSEEPPQENAEPPTPGSSLFREQPPPDPANFPPPDLHGYIAALRSARSLTQWDAPDHWFAYWRHTDRADDALRALKSGLDGGLHMRNYDTPFQHVLHDAGKTPAWEWLVRAQRESHGWLYYMSAREHVAARWDIVADLYLERWLEFIQASVGNGSRDAWRGMAAQPHFVRVCQYCLRMNRTAEALAVCESAVAALLQLVSPCSLPVPPW